MECDLHTHTVLSDGKNTTLENVRAAEAAGLECVAITDHARSEEIPWLERMLSEVREIRAGHPCPRVKVLSGMEAMITGLNGRIAAADEQAGRVDIVLADIGPGTEGVRKNFGGSAGELADNLITCYINLAENPLVHVAAHPFGAGRLKPALSPGDFPRRGVEKAARAFSETGTAFEIMNQMYWWFPERDVAEVSEAYLDIIKIFAEAGVKFTIGSDAHSAGAVGNRAWSLMMAGRAGLKSGDFFKPPLPSP